MSDGQRYELLLQSVIDFAIYMLDTDGRVVSWNAGAQNIKGYTAEEILGQHLSVFYTPEDRAAGRPAITLATAAEKGRFEDEAWRVRKDGTRFRASVVVDAIRDAEGQLVGYAKVTRDITERWAAQEKLLESERRFRILVEGVTDYAIYMLDPEGRITNWNTGAERAKGYTAAEVVGESFSRFYTPEDIATGLPFRALEIARTEGRFEAEGWRMRKDGTRFWAHVVIDAIRDPAGELVGYAKVTRDITERRDNQARLDEARAQLFQAQKNEALGQLTGGMAHDFNNLLTVILSGVELAMRQADPERTRGLLENVRSAAERGSALTRQLLAFARRQPLNPEPLPLQRNLPHTLEMLRHSVPAHIEIVTDIPPDIWRIQADPGELELALLNLGFNARDAMPEGGRLALTARNVVLSGDVEGLTGEHVAISITDTGVGIAPDIIGRVVEPFFTTKSFGQGVGLGLSQVYGFARQSGGALTIESELGTGSTLTLYMPVPASDLSAITQGAGAPRILVVEDDTVVAELAAQLLEDMGYAPEVVHSAQEALAALDRSARPALIFSDVVMPGGLNGIELAQKVRSRYPELPILLTSGYSAQLAKTPAEFPLVPKPYQYEALQTAVAALIGKSLEGAETA
jgi:PAS domain S-box-containing protein